VYALQKGEVLGEYGVEKGKTDSITVVADDDCTAFVKSGEKSEVALQLNIDTLCAPIAAGQKVGTVTVLINGEEYCTVNAVAKNGCQKKGYKDILDDFIEEW
ncbi:MAG: hypothetical protein K2L88_03455, partial [Clostridiales bacterium]|nr:hypothetical protein [Clostridiales bacterium]